MAQKRNQEPVSEPKTEFKGNDFISADNQRVYADLMAEMKARPELNKLMLAPEWSKIQAVLTFLVLKKLEEK